MVCDVGLVKGTMSIDQRYLPGARTFSNVGSTMLESTNRMNGQILSMEALLRERERLQRAVRELKGRSRPVVGETERAEMLAGLRSVDYVTIFDDISPRTLIASLLPDVLVKGGDYGLDEIHGREEVEAAGGRVVALPFIEGASTTGIIEKIRGE
jgi:rfaE bifunctional protein nucleotidyltransferase chain/domain